MTGVPRATITSIPRSESPFWFPEGTTTVYRVADELGTWGDFATYAAAAARLKTRRSVEKAMRTRRANKAKRARLEERLTFPRPGC